MPNKQTHYQIWKYRKDSVIIEKYMGSVDIDQILSNDEDIWEEILSETGPIIALTDISEASFSAIDINKISDLFKVINDNLSKAKGMKLALYTGNNCYENFEKASHYARHGLGHALSIIPFNVLESAMTWLGLTQSERESVKEQLMLH